jgi:hypothetical protein
MGDLVEAPEAPSGAVEAARGSGHDLEKRREERGDEQALPREGPPVAGPELELVAQHHRDAQADEPGRGIDDNLHE